MSARHPHSSDTAITMSTHNDLESNVGTTADGKSSSKANKRRSGQEALRELIRRKIQLPLGILRAFHDRAKMSPETRRRTLSDMQERFRDAMHTNTKRRPSANPPTDQGRQGPLNLVVDLADGSSIQVV